MSYEHAVLQKRAAEDAFTCFLASSGAWPDECILGREREKIFAISLEMSIFLLY